MPRTTLFLSVLGVGGWVEVGWGVGGRGGSGGRSGWVGGSVVVVVVVCVCLCLSVCLCPCLVSVLSASCRFLLATEFCVTMVRESETRVAAAIVSYACVLRVEDKMRTEEFGGRHTSGMKVNEKEKRYVKKQRHGKTQGEVERKGTKMTTRRDVDQPAEDETREELMMLDSEDDNCRFMRMATYLLHFLLV